MSSVNDKVRIRNSAEMIVICGVLRSQYLLGPVVEHIL